MTKQAAKSRIRWDERGLSIYFLELSFHVVGPSDQWIALARSLGFHIDAGSPADPTSWRASFEALPESLEPYGCYLTGDVHLHTHVVDEAHWILSWRRLQNAQPPKSIQATSAAVGGYPGILEKLAENWPTKTPLEASFTATYYIDDSMWKFNLQDKYQQIVRVGEQAFSMSSKIVDWNISPPSGAVRRIVTTTHDGSGPLTLGAVGSTAIDLTPNLVATVCQTISSGLLPFITPRGRK